MQKITGWQVVAKDGRAFCGPVRSEEECRRMSSYWNGSTVPVDCVQVEPGDKIIGTQILYASNMDGIDREVGRVPYEGTVQEFGDGQFCVEGFCYINLGAGLISLKRCMANTILVNRINGIDLRGL